MAEEANIEKTQPREKPYYIQSMVRRQGTRLHRVRSATRHRFKIFIDGRRLLRNKRLPMTAERVEVNRKLIQELILAGKIALFQPDGIRITSLPDGRLVLTKPSGATKIMDALAESAVEVTCSPDDPCDLATCTNCKESEGTDAGNAEGEQEGEESSEGGEGSKEDDKPPSEPDLTELPGIGSGRAKMLAEADVASFAGVVALGASGLSELLNISAEAAEDIHAAAKEMKG